LPSEDLMGFAGPVLNLPFVLQLRQRLATGLFDRVDATGFQFEDVISPAPPSVNAE